MSIPPLGYDDPSIVPFERLKGLVSKFEKELGTIQRVFNQHLPGEKFEVQRDLETDFALLRESATELGAEHQQIVEHLIAAYGSFKSSPDQEKLNHLFTDLERLKTFLAG